jgi:transposase
MRRKPPANGYSLDLTPPRQSFTRQRTFAWLLNDRRHSRDYERLTVNSAAMIQVSMIRLLLKRLA